MPNSVCGVCEREKADRHDEDDRCTRGLAPGLQGNALSCYQRGFALKSAKLQEAMRGLDQLSKAIKECAGSGYKKEGCLAAETLIKIHDEDHSAAVCSGCGLQAGPCYPREPTVSIRPGGNVLCADCFSKESK